MKILIDTHILLWYTQNNGLSKERIKIIDTARRQNSLFVSAMSFWEISLLMSKGRLKMTMNLSDWIDDVLDIPGLNLVELSVPILISANCLHDFANQDPADRIIVATARECNMHIMTKDRKILSYAQEGFVRAVEVEPAA